MKAQCNHCHRTIEVRIHGPSKVTCYCGAKYTKTVTVKVAED